MTKYYLFTERDRAELIRIIRKVDGFRGPGVINSSNNLSVSGPPPEQPSTSLGHPGVFPVLVYNDGGSAGTATSTINATYTTKDLSGTNTLGTGLSPLINRAVISPVDVIIAIAASGSIGTACYDGNGTLQLLWVQELPDYGC